MPHRLKLLWGKSLIALIVAMFWITPVTAQAGSWLPPVNVSNTSLPSQVPVVAADYAGRVHVIWGENLSGETRANPDTAFYTVLSDGVWSEPVDVIAVASGSYLYPTVLTVDRFGRLVFVFTRNGGLSVSIAPVEDAGTARGWTTVDLETTSRVNSASLTVDQSGAYHLVYVRNEREVVYTRSEDGGMNWLPPATVASVELRTQAVIGPHVAVDNNGGIFVTWTLSAEENGWFPVGVRFARSLDNGTQWEAAQEMANGLGLGSSVLLFAEPDTLHLYWNGSAGTRGRYHRYSLDRGATWSSTITAMSTEYGGFAGPAHLLLDSTNTLHVLVAGADAVRNSIWHSTWTGSSWTTPLRISGDLPDSQGAYAAIGLGHVISVVWNELQGGEVWYTSFDTGSPTLAPDRLPLPTQATSVTVLPTATAPTPYPTEVAALETPLSASHAQDLPTSAGTSSPTTAVLVGIIPAAVLVTAVILANARRRR